MHLLLLSLFFLSPMGLLATENMDVLNYRIQFQIDPSQDPKHFNAVAEMKIHHLDEGAHLLLDAEDLKIIQIETTSPFKKKLTHTWDDGKLKINYPRSIRKGETTSLSIQYQGKIDPKKQYGLFKVTDPDEEKRGPLLFTQLEPKGARRFFPCNDHPGDKAITEMEVTVPRGYEVISNGVLINSEILSIKGEPWERFHWKMVNPHPTYLVSLAIGRFSKVTISTKTPKMNLWVGEANREKTVYVAESTRKSLDFFEEYLRVPYPWEKYDTISLPTFFWGGMENTSATHMNQDRILLNHPYSEFEKRDILSLTAHELAHQWFGNSVTPKTWQDLWLNESFASYLDTLATDKILGNHESTLRLTAYTWDSYFKEEDGPRSHPIVDKGSSSVEDSFDATTYTKGENVIRMLHHAIGEEMLRKALRDYLVRFRYANANYLDFFSSVNLVTKKDYSRFRDSWLLQKGYPVLSYGGQWNASAKKYQFELEQHSNHENDGSLFVFKLPITIHRKRAPSYHIKKEIDVDSYKHAVEWNLPADPDWVTVNPGAVVLAKLNPKIEDKKILSLQATEDPDEATRLWANLELLTQLEKDTEKKAFEENTLVKTITSDPSPYVRVALLDRIQKFSPRWLPEHLGDEIFNYTRTTLSKSWAEKDYFKKDPHGWRQVRSYLLGSLGKIKNKDVLRFLDQTLQNETLGLDDLQMTAQSVARVGDIKSTQILKSALTAHDSRGYRYRYMILYAFGALENPIAAKEIENISKTATPDLLGKMGTLVQNNKTLVNSKEWAQFLESYLLNESEDDSVKSRMLETVELVETPHIQNMLRKVSSKCKSERIKNATAQILKKNFTKNVGS